MTFTTGSAVSSVFTVTSNSDDVWGGTRSFDVQFEFPDGQTLADCLASGQTDTLKVYVTEDDSECFEFINSLRCLHCVFVQVLIM